MGRCLNLITALTAMMISPLSFAANKLTLPPENQQATEAPPPAQSFDKAAEALLLAISSGSFADVRELFFPENVFLELKAIAHPQTYYQQLMTWFAKDFENEKKKLAKDAPVKFKSFKRGSCRWKSIQSEANAIAYWSCYRNKIIFEQADKEQQIDIKTLINWGPNWYITHLGPIPKN